MGKGEIARYEQFLLFPQCFQKACLQGASKGVIVWEWVNCKNPIKNERLLIIFNQNVLNKINNLYTQLYAYVEGGGGVGIIPPKTPPPPCIIRVQNLMFDLDISILITLLYLQSWYKRYLDLCGLRWGKK